MLPRARADFLKLWTGQTISEICSRITREGLPLTAVLVLGVSPARMGLLSAVGSAAVLVFGVGAGILADRVRRRPLMIGTDLARALVLASVPAAAAVGLLHYWQLVAVAALAGVLTVQFDVAYQSYLPSLLEKKDLLEGNRRLGMSASVAEILGPGLTGVLVQLITAPIAILVDALSFVVSAVSVWAIRTPEAEPKPQAHESLRAEAVEGARVILAHPTLRALALRSIAAFFSMGAMFALYVLYAMRVLRFNTATFGFMIALGGVGSLVGAYLSRRALRWLGAGQLLLASAVAGAAVNLLVPLAASLPRYALACMCAAQLVGDACWSLYFINEMTIRQQLAPEHVLGRVNAAMQLASRGMLPLGALAAGLLANWLGITGTLWAGSVGVLLSSLCLLPPNRIVHPE